MFGKKALPYQYILKTCKNVKLFTVKPEFWQPALYVNSLIFT